MRYPSYTALLGRRSALALGGVAANQGDKGAGLPISEIEATVGASGSVSDGVLSLGLDRTDLSATLPGGISVKPAFQLNGELDFQSIDDGRAIMNADFCLKPDETNPFMDALIAMSGFVLGISLTWATANGPALRADLERWGGALLVVSLAALGFALSLSPLKP